MGNSYSSAREVLFPPPPTVTVDNIPDLTGKVVLVTGANVGIGKETARVLLAKNAKVWIACRDATKGKAALDELKEQTGREAHLLQLDLANLLSIKQSAEEFASKEAQLHILYNNAGVMHPPSSPNGTVRVINVSSNAHWRGGLDFDTFKDTPKRRATSSYALYSQSKFGNIVFSAELNRRYRDQGIVSIAINPGPIRTELQRHHSWFLQPFFNRVLYDVSYGALTQLYAGTFPDAVNLGGKYLIPWARDPQLGKDLWAWLEDQVEGL
ncbi:hypothetical protein BKA82DRAFT_4178849 [Pisolithus tinctorius]|nr:hypothetical protein BKA82DRAFT_4178849 [Pisolithus tinctorius]